MSGEAWLDGRGEPKNGFRLKSIRCSLPLKQGFSTRKGGFEGFGKGPQIQTVGLLIFY